jgi:hypothetical protein
MMRAWLFELARVAPGIVESRMPGVGIDSRTREELAAVVARLAGSSLVEWMHEARREFLGRVESDEAVEPLLAFARASGEAGEPVDATTLDAIYAASIVRSTRAVVAGTEIRSAIAQSPLVPLLAPGAAAAGALRMIVRVAPPVPEPELPADGRTNLVMHLVADAMPRYLGNAAVRSVLLRNPLVLTIGVRMEAVGATVRIGRGKVRIDEGIDDDVVLVIEDGLEPLLHLAAGSIVRQLSRVPTR